MQACAAISSPPAYDAHAPARALLRPACARLVGGIGHSARPSVGRGLGIHSFESPLVAVLIADEAHDNIRYAAYRTAVKLRDLQVFTKRASG